ncbi:MAG: CYTH domain-containing protein [Bacteroidales bacterium]|nr:CYTH domain-containing protein [Bacteroidales bacterium]
MGKETERKFLVKGEFRHLAVRSYMIIQRYLCVDETRAVRVRISDNNALITIKGAPDKGSFSREEYEIPISVKEADSIMKLCLPGIIEKTRYVIPNGKHFFEVDVFHGSNEGLIVAEIELESEDEQFEKPVWLGKEVTGDPRFYNSSLIQQSIS